MLCAACCKRASKSQPKDRQDLVDKFQSNPSVRVALLGLTAAGIGITLTAASRFATVVAVRQVALQFITYAFVGSTSQSLTPQPHDLCGIGLASRLTMPGVCRPGCIRSKDRRIALMGKDNGDGTISITL